MNDDPNNPQPWNQPPQPWSEQSLPQNDQPQWNQPQAQYGQSQSQWDQPPATQYAQQPPFDPNQQYGGFAQQQQYGGFAQPQQYNVPAYAQAQQPGNNPNFWMRWLMMGLAVRIVLMIVIPLVVCGGCGMLVFLASIAHP